MANYGVISWPLTQQLKKDAFCWTKEADSLVDFSKDFIVEIDASGYVLGVVLMQDRRPIAYCSQVLSRISAKVCL